MAKRIVRNVIIAGVALALFSIGLLLGCHVERVKFAWDRSAWLDEKSVMRSEILDWRAYFEKERK
jgi:hypothetical protein